MKKFFTITVPIVAFIALAVQFVSCEKYVLPELSLGADTLTFSAAADSNVVSIDANVIWQAMLEDTDLNWLETGPSWWEGPGEAFVKVKDNTSSSARSASVLIKTETIHKSFLVIQQPCEAE